MTDNLTKEQRSLNMSRIRRRDTKPELMLRRALWDAGFRGYRVDRKTLPGRPDIAWGRARLAVFVDGAFWHGHPSAFTPGKSGDYWDEKIRRNCERDREADSALEKMGWTVVRFWDFEVMKELMVCIGRISTEMGLLVPGGLAAGTARSSAS
jgi:DNA mismatch endonuclease (patch repair protein)